METYGIEKLGIIGPKAVYRNMSPAQLTEAALRLGEGKLSASGAFVVTTGKYTGRSPKDKFIVDTDGVHNEIAWGKVNRPISREKFNAIKGKIASYLQNREVFIFDGYAGADKTYTQKFRVINELASQNLFIHQLLIRPTAEELASYGEPDYTKENVDVVEFTGYCMYKDVRVKALIQFELDKDAGTFEASYLSFNDVPQNGLTLAALLDTAFSGEESDTEDTEVEEDTETSENTTNTEEHVSEYVGDWIDTTSERCNMTIECDDGETYYIDINWSSSATENTHWELEAEYGEEENGLWYSGSCCNETYLDNGEVQEDYVYSNGQGFMFIGDDSCLHWDDYEEDAGSDCVFQRY